MKKIFFILISLLTAIVMLNANTLEVGVNQQYLTIQSAINESVDGDTVLVHKEGEPYGAFNFLEKNIVVRGFGNATTAIDSTIKIIQDNADVIVNMNNTYHATLEGFDISGSLNSNGISVFHCSENITIGLNAIHNINCGIVTNKTHEFGVFNTEIYDNQCGIDASSTFANTCIYVKNAKITHNTIGLTIGNAELLKIDKSLFADNYEVAINAQRALYQVLFFSSSTFANNPEFLRTQGTTTANMWNCIIWGTEGDFCNTEQHGSIIGICCSDIQGGFVGTGNIDKDPKFCTNSIYKYHLLEDSPCIDGSDSGITESDGTPLDMGCYSTADLDLKELQGNHWNWVSFPRLPRDGNDPVNAPNILSQMLPNLPNIDMENKQQYHLFYDGFNWNEPNYTITSDKGYKLNPEEDGTFTLPEHGTRLPADFTTPIYANQRNWVGYWLPQTQSVQDALGSQLDHIAVIKAENWYLYKKSGQWYGMVGMNGATFEYGKGYEIIAEQDFDLHWQFGSISPAFKSEATENFNYTQKADYEMIDIDAVDGAENVTEIGAFVDGVCVGASKVTEYPVHIQAYTDAVNRGSEFTFEIVTGRSVKKVANVQKYNFYNATFENASVYPTGKGFTKIRLSVKSNPENTVSPVRLESNYPNPFSISGKRGSMGTTIAFTIPENENVKLTIYNIKGQKVKSLLDKACTKGRTSIIWNGTDNNNRKVSSGVYFYRLETKQKSINKKMILVK